MISWLIARARAEIPEEDDGRCNGGDEEPEPAWLIDPWKLAGVPGDPILPGGGERIPPAERIRSM